MADQTAARGSLGRLRKKKHVGWLSMILLVLCLCKLSDAFQGFSTVSVWKRSRRSLSYEGVENHARRQCYTILSVKSVEDDNGSKEQAMRVSQAIDDDNIQVSQNHNDPLPSLFLPDAFAILLACQLMGLLDVVNDPQFLQAGGWFQPIPAMPSTLGILVERVALLGVIWIASTSLTATTVKEKEDAFLSSRERQPLAVFGAFRILEQLIVTALSSSSSSFDRLVDSTDWLTTSLRDVYFVALFIATLRFLYKKYSWY